MSNINQLINIAAKAGFETYGSFNEGDLQHDILTCTKGKYNGEVIDLYYNHNTGDVSKVEYSTQFRVDNIQPVFCFPELSTIQAFNFEVYTKNPETGEEGWDIMFPTVYAKSKEEAKEFLKTSYPNFDCIILFNYGCPIKDGSIDAKYYGLGFSYRDTEFDNRYNC